MPNSQNRSCLTAGHSWRMVALIVCLLLGPPADGQDQWLPATGVSPDHCDSTPLLDPQHPTVFDSSMQWRPTPVPIDQSTILHNQQSTLPTPREALPQPGLINTLPPNVLSPSEVSPPDERLHRLRELFGELHDRLDPSLVPESPEINELVTVPPVAIETSPEQPLEVVSPLPPQIEDNPELVATEANPTPSAFVLPEHIAQGVTNRLQLADNLFAANEIQMALDVYTAIDLDTEADPTRHWIMFQVAACYRRLGDAPEAAKGYRQLVTVEDPAWVGNLARWWLNAIETRNALTQRVDSLTSVINQFYEDLHANDGP